MAFADTMAGLAPLAWWRLGEASGTTMVDSSGNGHDGTYRGTPGFGAAGLVDDADTALSLNDDAAGVVTYDASLAVSTFSLFGVINIPESSNYPYVFAPWNGWVQLYVDDGGYVNLKLVTSGSTYVVSPDPITYNGTHQIGAAYDGSAATLYIDGGAVATATVPGTLTGSGYDLVIGGYQGSNEFHGTLDEVAFFDRALTDAQFAALAGNAPAPTGTSRTYSGDGYNYAGSGAVDFSPAVDANQSYAVPIRRVHQSLPAPTLVDGRPT